jgi:outer membrane lipoprotein LolB
MKRFRSSLDISFGSIEVRWLIVCWLSLLTACANFNSPHDKTTQDSWQGRVAVNIASDPAQAFSAHFALKGSASEGLLTLTSMLGTRVATLRWSAYGAALQTPQELRQFESADAMLMHILGTPLPLATLFGWLQGDRVPGPGWDVDLLDLSAGRIRARRLASDPAAEIKIILEPR